MNRRQLTDAQAWETILTAGEFLLFKHSRVCPISARAFARYEEFISEHPEVPTGFIDVIAQRPWSQWVAAETGITHESPQALWIRDGAVAWDDSHLAISKEALEAAAT